MNGAVALARDLVRLDTVRGGESAAARLVAERLAVTGIASELHELAPGRESLIARLPGRDLDAPALCFTGHLDTVGLGSGSWARDPLGGQVDGDRLWGRGSSDMKSGVAAMVVAVEALAFRPLARPLILALCASEESGAQGAAQLAGHLGSVGAIVVGEPTAGRVAVAHKGVAWVRLQSHGKAAHGSTPHLGSNAITAMAGAVQRLTDLRLHADSHPHLSAPTLNVGSIHGGEAPNVVPDRCEAAVDVRLVPGFQPDDAVAAISGAVGALADVSIELALPAVHSSPHDPWLQTVLRHAGGDPFGVNYFTDASVLAPALGHPPVAVVGPGEPDLAHQVDEWCSVAAITRAAELYERLAIDLDDSRRRTTVIPTTAHSVGPATPPVRDLTLGGVLADATVAAPDGMALIASESGESWTYRELHDVSANGAAVLAGRFEPGERVAIWAHNLPEWVIAEFACAMAGLVIVTVNPAFTAGEAQYVLAQSGAAAVLTIGEYRGRPLLEVAEGLRAECPRLREVIDLHEFGAAARMASAVDVHLPEVRPTDAVMIQYTSGTTGRPKGAVLNHRGLANNGQHTMALMGVGRGDVSLTVMPLFHTAGSVLCVLGAVTNQATQILVPAFEPGHVLDAVEKHGVNALLGVPTMLIALLEHPSYPSRDLSCVRVVGSGGSPVPARLVEWLEQELGADFIIVMGQTEASPVSAMTRPDDLLDDKANTIGTAMPGIELKIVDPTTGRTVAPGVTGEYCTRGYHVMDGYFGRPEQTAEAIDAEGWLHSGDLCSMDERGYCRVEGRLKDMIIRGGENIYPREIEDCLFEHPAVSESAIVGLPDDRWGETVAAFVRAAPGHRLNRADLQAWVRDRMAAHKTPVHWFEVDAFPLTGSGKIQKFKLLESWRGGDVTPLAS